MLTELYFAASLVSHILVEGLGRDVTQPSAVPRTLIAVDGGQIYVVGQTQFTLSVGDKRITHSFSVVQDFMHFLFSWVPTFCELSAPSLATRMALSHLAALVQVKKPHSLFRLFY